MNKPLLSILAAVFISFTVSAQITDPEITTWILNTNNHMVNGILTDVQDVHYDASFVYVHSSTIPSYYDFNNPNVNDASDKNRTWKITRTPAAASTPASNLNGGQCGVIIDGSTFFNPEDARSYQNANIWHQLAWFFEGNDFDSTLGHSTPTNDYHHHVIDLAYIDTSDHTHHSPIIGWCFDGYPVYGPYGYTDANDTNSAIVRMTPSWQKRNITQRTTLPDGTVLQASQYGPGFTGQTILGCYREDYEYVAASGMLDTHNGRFCKTPEYPNGIYAYFATIDSLNHPLYPEFVGQTFYGVLTQGNMGPNGGSNTVPGTATLYVPSVTTAISETNSIEWAMFPNPAQNSITVQLNNTGNYTIQLTDISGRIFDNRISANSTEQIDVSNLASGTYIITVTNNITGRKSMNRCIKL